MCVSSPALEPGHWYLKLEQSSDGSVKKGSDDLVCAECLKLPPIEMVKCLHKKPTGNVLKCSTVRKQAGTTGIDPEVILRETLGHSTQRDSGYYKKRLLDILFDTANRSFENLTPELWIACFDPNAGDFNETAGIFGCVINDVYHVVYIDSKQTKSYKEFCAFFVDSLKTLHTNFRKDRRVPVAVFVEGVSSWNGDVVHERLQNEVNFNNVKELENMWVVSDIAKQKHDELRRGVTVNAGRLNNMTYRMESALGCGKVKIHSDFFTNSPLGRGGILRVFEDQMRRFEHFEKGSNSCWDANGKRRKNNNAKKTGLNDDISDAFHMFISWWYWFMNNDDYIDQRHIIGLR